MRTPNKMVDKSMFVFVWFTITTISMALVAVFVVGLKTIFSG